MTSMNVLVCCLAYVLGLLLTGLPWKLLGLPMGVVWLLAMAVVAFFLPRRIAAIHPRIWLMAGLCGYLAILHFQFRLPQPDRMDVSRFADDAIVQVEGRIASPPRLTRSQRVQFELEATDFYKEVTQLQVSSPEQSKPEQSKPEKVSGRVYVTVPRSQDSQLYPGRTVQITGSLYKPKAASNPGGFDFRQYLAQQGIFAGMNGQEMRFPPQGRRSPPFLWSMQQRIIQAQALRIDAGVGALLSAMVMGDGGVDVPYEIQDQFARVGLAHALAASGTQVSLLTAIVLMLTQRLNRWTRFTLGCSILMIYVGLTGLEPSVLRAAIMGVAVFLAQTLERQVKPLPLLLLVATLLLIWNPIWIWNLGFQLSFLATLGLVVTVTKLSQWLDWLPTRVTPLIAVPIAAYLWTLPLQLFVFGTVSPYCIVINILASLLISMLSIGGMASALLALMHPLAGSGSAWLLQFPAIALLKMAELGDHLPGNAYAIGTISAVQLVILYGLYLWVWGQKHWHSQGWVAGMVGLALVAVPVLYNATHLFQITVLATTTDPVMVVRDRGKVGLINVGNEADMRFTILPFLQQQGINQVDWAIAPQLQTADTEGWNQMLDRIPIRLFYAVPTAKPEPSPQAFTTAYQDLRHHVEALQGSALNLSSHQKVQSSTLTAQLRSANPAVLQLEVQGKKWLLLHHLRGNEQRRARLSAADVLWWSGEALSPELLEQVKPQVAIASARSIPKATQDWFKAHPATTLYQTGRDGAVQWTASQGFRTMRETLMEPAS